jgi:DNA-binding MarR family transcriptional regulator
VAHASERTSGDEPTIDAPDQFVDLARLIGETLAGLKHSGPPPPELQGTFERFALGPRHVPALMAVTLSGPLSVSDLARQLGHTLPTTSTIVGELSRAGLLDRAEDDHDRRRTIVRVHADHARSITDWAHRTLAPLRATLQRLSPHAREHFIAGWHILHEETVRGPGRADVEN